MIILDENLQDDRLVDAIGAWYPGRVVYLTDLQPYAHIKDEAVTSILRRADEPTFVTINSIDFWRRTVPHTQYCIIAADLPKEKAVEIPTLLRRLLRLDDFRTKASRMGKVVRVTSTQIEYYATDRVVRSVVWPASTSHR